MRGRRRSPKRQASLLKTAVSSCMGTSLSPEKCQNPPNDFPRWNTRQINRVLNPAHTAGRPPVIFFIIRSPEPWPTIQINSRLPRRAAQALQTPVRAASMKRDASTTRAFAGQYSISASHSPSGTPATRTGGRYASVSFLQAPPRVTGKRRAHSYLAYRTAFPESYSGCAWTSLLSTQHGTGVYAAQRLADAHWCSGEIRLVHVALFPRENGRW